MQKIHTDMISDHNVHRILAEHLLFKRFFGHDSNDLDTLESKIERHRNATPTRRLSPFG